MEVEVSKKTEQLIKPIKLKNHKKFRFGFQNLKSIEPNQIKPIQPSQYLKKKRYK
jgi:hypothetical protein